MVKSIKFGKSCTDFFQTRKLTINDICQKIVYLSKSVKNVTLLPAEKFENINLYQQIVLLKIISDLKFYRIEVFFMEK